RDLDPDCLVVGQRRAQPLLRDRASCRCTRRSCDDPSFARPLDAGHMTGAPVEPMGSTVPKTNSGAGRVLVAVYGIFALAATARASVQLLTKFEQAPLAYLLSALAGLIYIVATI